MQQQIQQRVPFDISTVGWIAGCGLLWFNILSNVFLHAEQGNIKVLPNLLRMAGLALLLGGVSTDLLGSLYDWFITAFGGGTRAVAGGFQWKYLAKALCNACQAVGLFACLISSSLYPTKRLQAGMDADLVSPLKGLAGDKYSGWMPSLSISSFLPGIVTTPISFLSMESSMLLTTGILLTCVGLLGDILLRQNRNVMDNTVAFRVLLDSLCLALLIGGCGFIAVSFTFQSILSKGLINGLFNTVWNAAKLVAGGFVVGKLAGAETGGLYKISNKVATFFQARAHLA